ncbi:hypothetical protein B484DRAFT_227788 [Ochromonadaceae sp. CCMP2298]|nr:hypothetical protein B484DRAFT_227788 [Ochromonadaceae sp. CCMP2298]
MMGSGEMRPRKVVGAVPHDLGSPSESPWARTNAYNFQDVSSWKDLGPKFVLQVFRDYVYLRRNGQEQGAAGVGVGKEPEHAPSEVFLSDLYPALLQVMRSTELFDTDGDGMIENSGFPDQTYDIWTAKGVHAYCGGVSPACCAPTHTLSHTHLLSFIHHQTHPHTHPYTHTHIPTYTNSHTREYIHAPATAMGGSLRSHGLRGLPAARRAQQVPLLRLGRPIPSRVRVPAVERSLPGLRQLRGCPQLQHHGGHAGRPVVCPGLRAAPAGHPANGPELLPEHLRPQRDSVW